MEAIVAGRALIRYCLYGWIIDLFMPPHTNNSNTNANKTTNQKNNN